MREECVASICMCQGDGGGGRTEYRSEVYCVYVCVYGGLEGFECFFKDLCRDIIACILCVINS